MSKVYTYNEKLKYARELRGWSQEELARRVGCLADSMDRRGVVLDVSTISRWERGRNSPSPFYRQLLCSLFDMNAEELGLLPADNVSQEETISLQEVGSLEVDPGTYTVPITDAYTREMSDAIRQNSRDLYTIETSAYSIKQENVFQDLDVAETPPPDSPQHFLFRRRKFLLALLASAALGGGATVAAKLLLSPTNAAASRHWPEVTPDIHKQSARIRVIQWMLNAQGGRLRVDGIFWVQTENALMLFQQNENLPATTTVNSTTWERLILSSTMVDQQTINQGSQVKALQEMLNDYGASPRLHVDGGFGPLTKAATIHFQQTHQLPVNGQADLNTWCVLVGGYLK